ncbi:MAG: hypothetical protein QOD98_2910 [Nocardioidaceae bacterium]|nr:hypothetical protein [Nocardioidaceae bacterium]
MDFDEYVAARYGRLIEHAVLLGCAEGEAGTYVDQVLLEQRKRIGRAEDPDPLVQEALEGAISGVPQRSRRAGPLVAIGLVAVAVAVGAGLTYRPPPRPVPSLFALDASQAQRLLEDQGYDVRLRPDRSCEPQGLVLGSDPPTGTLVREGQTVTVHTAAASGVFCQALFLARSDAWQFVAFALGGKAPQFADTVTLLVSGSMARSFVQADATDRKRWAEAFDLIEKAAHQAAPTTSGMPALRVDVTVPPDTWCGVPRPEETGGRFALRLEIDPRVARDGRGCPLTIDLYRSERVIDTVVVYTAKADGTGLEVDPVGLRPARVLD